MFFQIFCISLQIKIKELDMKKYLKLLSVLSLMMFGFTSFAGNTDTIEVKSDSIMLKNDEKFALKNKLFFDIETKGFFVDNEFKRQVAYGYTLPGMRVVPRLTYFLQENVSLSLGFSALRYWGLETYPRYLYSSVPEYSAKNNQHTLHFLPFMRFDWKINDKLSFTLGNIDNSEGHGLDVALWNSELSLSQDYEEGMQLKYQSMIGEDELWVNWQNFNLKNDIDRESLLVGWSGNKNIYWNNYMDALSFSYAFLWQHHGGELDTLTTLPLDHWTNGNIGVNYIHLIGKKYFQFFFLSFDYFFSKALKNDTWFFKDGHAWFAKATLYGSNYSAHIGYYYSHQMISLYGSPFFSNLAERNPNAYYPNNHLLYGRFDYNLTKTKTFNITAFTELFYKLDTKTNIQTEDRNLSLSIGLKMEYDDRFFIKTKRSAINTWR